MQYQIYIDNKPYDILNAHLDQSYVEVGQRIDKGSTIGSVGSTGISTGSHLHIEVKNEGEHLDPLKFIFLN